MRLLTGPPTPAADEQRTTDRPVPAHLSAATRAFCVLRAAIGAALPPLLFLWIIGDLPPAFWVTHPSGAFYLVLPGLITVVAVSLPAGSTEARIDWLRRGVRLHLVLVSLVSACAVADFAVMASLYRTHSPQPHPEFMTRMMASLLQLSPIYLDPDWERIFPAGTGFLAGILAAIYDSLLLLVLPQRADPGIARVTFAYATRISIMLVLVASFASSVRVIEKAESAAGDRPYCIENPTWKADESQHYHTGDVSYFAASDWFSLTAWRLHGISTVFWGASTAMVWRQPHGVLIIKDADQWVAKHWSYLALNFVDPINVAGAVPPCVTKPHFRLRLLW